MFVEGIISGIIASFIVLCVQEIKDYNHRKYVEKIKMYDFDKIRERDAMAPPEYPRETLCNNQAGCDTIDIVKISFPFDIKEIKIFENDRQVYPTDNYAILPANEPIYVDCKLNCNENPIFTVKCKTFTHEYREYEYIPMKKHTDGFSGYRLTLKKQTFIL